MSAQLSYSIDQGKAYAGMLADLHDTDVISRSIETAAGANFGIAVSRGTDKDKQAVIGGASGYLGVTLRSLERENSSTNTIKYSQKETAGILREGYIYAVCPTGCVPGDLVNYANATGILDSGTAVAGETQLTGSVWDTTAVAGELAIIRLAGIQTTAGV